MPFNPKKPYNDLPLLPPQRDVETRTILQQAVKATRSLAELKGAGGLIPDQAILINAIPLQEAKASSEIENIVTTQDELFKAALDETAVTDPQTKEVLRYRTALRQGYEALKKNEKLSLEMVRQVCETLRGEKVSFRNETEQVYIGNAAFGRVTYTPPSGGDILLQKLQNLETYLLASEGPDPLIRMAVGHYQFEAIHPFIDGNGRTGRILNMLYLLQTGLLDIPVLYLSRFIIQRKGEYYTLLREVTEKNEWEKWVIFLLQGVEETSNWTIRHIQAIRSLLETTIERCRTEIPKVYSKELIELIFRQPYCKISFVVDAGIAERKTASVYLKELERIGILDGEKRGREIIYRHPALVEVLTA